MVLKHCILERGNEMSIRDYRDLIVRQKAMDLVEVIYRASASFPREEVYGLTSQMRRAAISIPSNIAEGHGRYTTPDYLHFISITHGSLKELETQVFIARRLGYITAALENRVTSLTAEVGRLLNGLTDALKQKCPRTTTNRRPALETRPQPPDP
jgi:four helix bundle protein